MSEDIKTIGIMLLAAALVGIFGIALQLLFSMGL
jgi:hypothetical protein